MTEITIKTWRERIGAGADFPLHAPTDVERAMEAEIAELRGRVGAPQAGYKLMPKQLTKEMEAACLKAAREYREETGGISFYVIYEAAIDAAPVVQEGESSSVQPTAEMLDMLGRIEPLSMHDKQERDQWFERLCRARAVQQPLPVPDQAAVVWRSDLVRAVAELLQLRAYRDFDKAQRARKGEAVQQLAEAQDQVPHLDEQAAVIHLMLKMHQKHGANWLAYCEAYMRTISATSAQQAAAEPRVWQQCEGASLIFSIKGLEEVAPGIRAVVTREPTVGKWYAGVNNSQPLPVYGATARYEGEGRWYLGTGNRIDLYQYDYLQELV